MASSPIPDSSTIALARETAHQLIQDLEEARRATGNWIDRPQTERLASAAMGRCLTRLATSNCWGDANRSPSNELWKIAGGVLRSGWLQLRAREKPRGYAGDFELLARIDRHETCDHPLGRAFDRYFQDQAAPRAVRNRHQRLAQELVAMVRQRGGRPILWVSVGCGPACDAQAALHNLSEHEAANVRFVLLDLDPDALAFARQAISRLAPTCRLHLVRENLFRLARLPQKAAVLQDADLLTCPGLFDYLNPPDASAMLATFWRRLAPGGRLLVFNFAPRHASQAYMEWIGNWYLTYRNRDMLLAMAADSAIPRDSVTVSSGTLATDRVIIAEKPFA